MKNIRRVGKIFIISLLIVFPVISFWGSICYYPFETLSTLTTLLILIFILNKLKINNRFD
jgi:hypothetical protein